MLLIAACLLCYLCLQEWNVQQLCYEVDVEPYAKGRDAAVGRLAAEAGVAVSPCVSHTLYVSACRGAA
jgi:cryptochrome